ncbi:methionyl-tRNA formyltransferase [bacterium DOLJORAL78_65_58]|nr:MAG: methionyl-tRNA formyltransferase [bacterium DOLZORAL124_64_63]PIE75819.1 MAG: methionyl-tRNA formyltransferase [bacterium DOLJORAL78_65_58]
MKDSGRDFVVAASRPGYEAMTRRLARDLGRRFHLVSRPEELTPAFLKERNPELVFLPHWSTIIPAAVHENFECVVFHMTDLPYGRGGSPLQNLIARGHTETRLSALRCTAQLDAGPIYLKKDLSLAGSAREIFARGALLVEEMIREIIATRPRPVPQEGRAVVFKRRVPAQSNLAGLTEVGKIHDHIRMLDADGYPHAFLEVAGLRYEFTDSRLEDGAVEARVRIVPTNREESP